MKLPWVLSNRPSRDPEAVPPATTRPRQGAAGDAPRSRETSLELETLSRRVEAHALSIDALSSQVGDLRERMDRLTMAVAEGIEHVERAERRVRATVARARRELAEDGVVSPGLEAEHEQLREVDGDGGEERGVPPVRESVGQRSDAPIELGDAFPGAWTQGDIASLMGVGDE